MATTPSAGPEPTPSETGQNPINPRDAALQFVVTKTLADHCASAMKTLREHAGDAFRRGDRLTVTSPVDDTPLGTVSATNPGREAVVVDRDEFNQWMLENYDDRCEDTPIILASTAQLVDLLAEHAPHLLTWDRRPADWAENEVLKLSAKVGQPIGPGGEIGEHAPPGIEVRTKASTVQVRLAEDAFDRVAELWRAGRVDPLALPPASDAA